MQPRWLDRVQAADYIHAQPERIDEFVRQGRLLCSVLDGQSLFFVEHLDQLLFSLQRPAGVGRAPLVASGVEPSAQRRTLPVVDGCRREQVEGLLGTLKSKKENPGQHGKVLVEELGRALARSDYRSIPRSVGARLAKWAQPLRHDDRTRVVTPLARKLSELLFGNVLPRID